MIKLIVLCLILILSNKAVSSIVVNSEQNIENISFEAIQNDILNKNKLNIKMVLNVLKEHQDIHPDKVNYLLGTIYFFGKYQEKVNVNKAADCLRRSAKNEHAPSLYLLGTILTEPDTSVVEKQEGIYFLSKAADQGSVDAIINLHDMYVKKYFHEKNKLIDWLYYATNAGDEDAAFLYGMMLFDEGEANNNLELIYKAEQHFLNFEFKENELEAIYILSAIYGLSDSPLYNKEKRNRYLVMASERGHDYSTSFIKYLKENGYW